MSGICISPTISSISPFKCKNSFSCATKYRDRFRCHFRWYFLFYFTFGLYYHLVHKSLEAESRSLLSVWYVSRWFVSFVCVFTFLCKRDKSVSIIVPLLRKSQTKCKTNIAREKLKINFPAITVETIDRLFFYRSFYASPFDLS